MCTTHDLLSGFKCTFYLLEYSLNPHTFLCTWNSRIVCTSICKFLSYKNFNAGGVQCQQTSQLGQEEEKKAELAWLLPTQVLQESIAEASDEGSSQNAIWYILRSYCLLSQSTAYYFCLNLIFVLTSTLMVLGCFRLVSLGILGEKWMQSIITYQRLRNCQKK